jgi:hypothetical protein
MGRIAPGMARLKEGPLGAGEAPAGQVGMEMWVRIFWKRFNVSMYRVK